MNPDALIERLRFATNALGVSQLDLAIATGVHQSQISRMLSGRVRRASKNLLKVTAYIENLHSGNAKEAEIPDVLKDAIRFSWDGSAEHADALAKVILSLRQLGVGRRSTF